MISKKQRSVLDRLTVISNKYGKVWLAVVVIGALSIIGITMLQRSSASSIGSIYLSPTTATVSQGQIITVEVHEVSGTIPVNAVQTAISYNSSIVQYVGMTEGTAFPTIAATDTTIPNELRIARATAAGTTVTDDQVLVILTFKVLVRSGTTSLGINTTYSFIVQASDNTNILSGTSGASYQISRGQSGGAGKKK